MQADKKIQVSRGQCLMDEPFIGTLLCRLIIKERNDIPTMATEGKHIFYNREFVESLSLDDLKFVMMHEVYHCAFFHHTRRGYRDPKLWNIAGDYAINPILVNSGRRMLESGLYDKKYDGWSAEKIYDDILDNAEIVEMAGNMEGDCGGTGIFVDASETEAGRAESEADWNQRIVAAVESAKMRGNVPGEFEDYVKEFLDPKVPWHDKLRQYARDQVKSDYNWTRPMKKMIAEGVYLPSEQPEDGINKAVVVKDTSGSITHYPELLQQFGGEISSMLEEGLIEEMYVLDVDTEVQGVQLLTKEDTPLTELGVNGGGGTAFEPAFDWVEENNIYPSLFIYLTDMCGSFPDTPPNYPVIWVAYDSSPEYYRDKCKFGDIIEVN